MPRICKPKICRFTKRKNEKGIECIGANIKNLSPKMVRELKSALNEFCSDFFDEKGDTDSVGDG